MKFFSKGRLLVLVTLMILLIGCVESSGPDSNDNSKNENLSNKDNGLSNEDETNVEYLEDASILTLWDWDEVFMTHMTQMYKDINPNVQINTLVVAASDYLQKLQSTLASGGTVPDIILAEMNDKGTIFDLGILEDISQEPYNYGSENQFDYSATLSKNIDGDFLGVDQQICPAGFAYRRDLALKYLGTEDPYEIGEMISDYDKFYEVAEKIKSDSNGEVVAFPGVTTLVQDVLTRQFAEPYIDGNDINITDRYTSVFDIATKLNQAGLLGKMEKETPSLYSGFAEGDFVFYPVTAWSMKWEIAQNDPDGSGRWGMTTAPENGFTYGGTTVGIFKNSENKKEAWDYIKYTYIDGDGIKEAFNQFGNMTGDKKIYTNDSFYFTEKGEYDDFFGGQQVADFLINEISVDTVGQIQTKNESQVTTALMAVAAQMSGNSSMTTQDCLDSLINEVQLLVPEGNVY